MTTKNILTILGIALNTLGTILTLWTIFATKTNMAGTVWEYDHCGEEFPKEKRRVIAGSICIVTGNLLQMISVFL